MHREWNKFIKIHQVVLWNLRNVKDYNKSVIIWPVDVGRFHQEKVGGLIDEGVEIALRGAILLVWLMMAMRASWWSAPVVSL